VQALDFNIKMNIESAQSQATNANLKESRHQEMEKKGQEEWEKSSNTSNLDRPHEHSEQFKYFERERENNKHPVIAYGDGGDFNELAKQADNPATGAKISGESEFGTKRSEFFGGEPDKPSGGKDSKYQSHQNEARFTPQSAAESGNEMLAHTNEHGESFLQAAADVASETVQSVKDATLNVFQKTADALGFSGKDQSDASAKAKEKEWHVSN
jgi:hypothetical protein